MGFGCKESVSLQPMHDPMDVRLGLHSKPFGDDFIRRSNTVDTDIRLDEIQNKLSAWGHFVTAVTLVTFSSLNASANVRKGFKRNIYTPGV